VSALADRIGAGDIGQAIAQESAPEGTLVPVVSVNTRLARAQDSTTCHATHPPFPGLASSSRDQA
jgi:hypothetical protein